MELKDVETEIKDLWHAVRDMADGDISEIWSAIRGLENCIRELRDRQPVTTDTSNSYMQTLEKTLTTATKEQRKEIIQQNRELMMNKVKSLIGDIVIMELVFNKTKGE